MKKILKFTYAFSVKFSFLVGSSHGIASPKLKMEPWMTERRIIGSNNLEPVTSQAGTELYDLARVVARLETTDGMGYCSGSRVGENLFLTNYHCQESLDCEDIVIHMGYEAGVDKSRQGVFQCQKILASNETYDYALLEARWVGSQAEVESARQGGDQPLLETVELSMVSQEDFPIAHLYVGALAAETPVIVPSHPRGRLKEIDQSHECMILSTELISVSMRETMTHSCDTEGGSSGSPVISRQLGAIVGLHWGGVSNQNYMIPIASVVEDLRTKVSEAEFLGLNLTTGPI